MRYSFRFVFICTIFVTSLVLANTISTKLITIGNFVVAGGIIIFPVTYIFGDILTEVYGYRESRKIIWLGFFAQFLTALGYSIVQYIPAPVFWQNQEAYNSILGLVPRIVIASLVAYLVGEFANSIMLSYMKVRMQGKKLWMRTIGSTIVGQGFDSVIFALIAFGGVLSRPELWTIILSGYVLKVLYEILATPLTYSIVSYLKRTESIDVYDTNVAYNPLKR